MTLKELKELKVALLYSGIEIDELKQERLDRVNQQIELIKLGVTKDGES